MGKYIHWLLLKKYGIPTGNKWYNHVPNVVTEKDDGKVTIYWDKPDVVKVDREKNTWTLWILRSQWIIMPRKVLNF